MRTVDLTGWNASTIDKYIDRSASTVGLSSPIDKQLITAKCIGISDGDTIKVLVGNEQVRITVRYCRTVGPGSQGWPVV